MNTQKIIYLAIVKFAKLTLYIKKADVARALYQGHAKKEFDENSIYVTVDL